MKTTRFILGLFLVAAFVTALAGCGKVPVTHFYSLEPPAESPAGKTLPYDVEVFRFRTSYRLSQDRLVFMPAPYQVDYYNYHRWAGYPADLVTGALITSLKHARVFRSVSEVRTGLSPDYLLKGEIENLEEVDSPGVATAKVSISLDAIDAHTHAVVWSGSAQYEKGVTTGNVDDVARELNEGVRQTLDKLTHDIAAKFPEKTATP